MKKNKCCLTVIYKQVHPNPFKINTLNQKIIKICEEKFIYLNYSPRTKDNYLGHIKDFLMSLGDKQVIHCNCIYYSKCFINALQMTIYNSGFTKKLGTFQIDERGFNSINIQHSGGDKN